MHDTCWAWGYIVLAAVECLHCCGIKVSFKAKDQSFEESICRRLKQWGPCWYSKTGLSCEQVKNRSCEQSLATTADQSMKAALVGFSYVDLIQISIMWEFGVWLRASL